MLPKFIKPVVVAATAFSLIGSPALAGDDTNVTVMGGSLSISAITAGDFSEVTLSGVAQQTTAVLSPFTVVDARGNGAGWQVQVQASQFAEYDGDAYVTDGRILPVGSLTMEQVLVTANGTASPPPVVSGGPYTIDAGTAVPIAIADAGEGMGTYDFGAADGAITLTLSVPADAYAGTYRSDVTVDVTLAP